MTKNIRKMDSLPEILYEAPTTPGEPGNPIPYIEVQKDHQMPQVLYIFEYRDTGEIEPDERGRPAKIIDQIPHQYVDLAFLFSNLDKKLHDKVRVSLGMKPLKQARKEGQKILDSVFSKAESLKAASIGEQDSRVEKIKEALERTKEKVESESGESR